MRQVISLLVITLSASAHAQTADFCPDFFALSKSVNTCGFNALFVKAADRCNAAIDALSQKYSANLGISLGQNGQNFTAAQLADLQNHSTNLGSATDSLRDLRANSAKAKDQMLIYRANFMRPGKISAGLAAHLHRPFLDWLEQFPCYKGNYEQITGYVSVMDTKIAQLDTTLQSVGALAGSTANAASHVGSGSATTLVKAAAGAAPAAVPAGNPTRGTSSITGIEQDAKKSAAKP